MMHSMYSKHSFLAFCLKETKNQMVQKSHAQAVSKIQVDEGQVMIYLLLGTE